MQPGQYLEVVGGLAVLCDDAVPDKEVDDDHVAVGLELAREQGLLDLRDGPEVEGLDLVVLGGQGDCVREGQVVDIQDVWADCF